MLIAWNFWDSIANGLTGLSLMIDGIVYWLVSLLFDLYEQLAGFQFLTENAYNEIVDRFYVIIGVVMLFYLAYALLKALVNPDELTKSTSKIVMNIVVSLVLLNVVPIIFTYAYKLQNVIISEDRIVSKIVLGNANENIATVGRETAMIFLESFLKPTANAEIEGYANWTSLKTCILNNNYQDENGNRCNGNEGFRHITLLADSITSGDTEYTFIISTLCGAFLVYVIASFCLDLGVRVVKLAFYQIISPIPILMRIIPEKKSVFDNWIKATLATYLEVFIRLFIIYLITYLCTIIPDVIKTSFKDNPDLGLFAIVVVLMGIFAFAKQAPKLIGDVIGVNAGNLKLGIKDKLADGGAFAAGALIGGGVTSGIRNLTHGALNVKNAQGFRNKAKALAGMATSTVAGTFSGAARSGYGARNAKTYADVKKYASEGATAAGKARDNREAYKASHGGTLRGVAAGHIADAGYDIKNWATGGTAGILGRTKFEEEFKNSYKEYEAIYENPKYNAMKSQLQQYEALKASGVTTYEGKNVSDAIKELKGNMLKARMDAMKDNTQSAAYAMYNITQLAKKNPALANEIGIDISMAKDIELRGNRIIDKTTNTEVTAEKLYEMIEGTSLRGVTYNGTNYVDSTGTAVDFVTTADTQNKDGMSHQKKKASDQLRRDQLSVEYKEAQKKQEKK